MQRQGLMVQFAEDGGGTMNQQGESPQITLYLDKV